MNRIAIAVLAASTLLSAGGASAGQRYTRQCMAEDGQIGYTNRAACPPNTREIKKTIAVCLLPDGSKAFGDSCPEEADSKQKLDPRSLSHRDNGMHDPDKYAHESAIQQRQYTVQQQEQEARQREYMEAAEERARQAEAERQANSVRHSAPQPNSKSIWR